MLSAAEDTRTAPMPHVLVVDDQPDVCAFVAMALEEIGHYRVSAARTADEALPLLDRDRPDLVLLDAVMPGMPAMEFALHSTQRGIPLVVMTGHPDMIDTLDGLGWPLLRKPFHLDQLLVECAATIVECKQNLVMVRASLDRLLDNRVELSHLIERSRRSVAASKARRDAAAGEPRERRPPSS
jgi:DNA-binding response OmpR family regulator